MGFIKDIIQAYASKILTKENRVSPIIAESADAGGSGVDPMGSVGSYLATYATVQWVYACVEAIYTAMSQLPKKVYVGKDEDKTDISDNKAFKFFLNPDPHRTNIEFWEYSIGFKKLTGELFWYLVRESENQPPQRMIPLNPARMTIVPSKNPDQWIKGFVHDINGTATPFESWEIFYSRYFNPLSDYRGLSPLQAAKNDIVLDLNAVNWSKNFFKDGARPSGVLSVPELLNEPEFIRLSKRFNQQYSGKQKTMILEKGTVYQSLSLAQKDVDFIEQRKMTKSAVLSVYKVPPIKVMDLRDSSILQNTDIQDKLFWEMIQSECIRLSEEISTEVLPMFGVEDAYMEFDLSGISALQEAKEAKEKRYNSGFSQGAITPNDIRVDVFGKEPINDASMNTTYLASNLFPIGQDTEPEKQKQIKAIKRKEVEEERNIALWKTFVSRVVPIERRYVPELEKFFKALEKEVLKNFSKQKNLEYIESLIKLLTYSEKVDFSIEQLFNEKEWIEKLKKTGHPFLAEAIELGGVSVITDLIGDVVFDMTNPFVVDTITRRLDEFATKVIGTTQDDIVKAISDGLRENETIEQITTRLKHKFDVAEQARAPRIARTEVSTGHNAGNMEGIRQSGIVENHKWLTSRDQDVRDSHKIDGQVRKCGNDFSFPGEYTGWTKQYPSDYNERCTTVPTVDKVN